MVHLEFRLHEGVERDVDRIEPSLEEGCQLLLERNPVGRHPQRLHGGVRPDSLDDVDNVGPHEWFPASQSNLCHACS